MRILIKKDVEATEGRGGETSFWGAGGGSCENSVGLSICESLLWKLLNTFGQILGASLIGFCHKTAEIHSLCIS